MSNWSLFCHNFSTLNPGNYPGGGEPPAELEYPECFPYLCSAYSDWAKANGIYYWEAQNNPTDGFLEGYSTTPNIAVGGGHSLVAARNIDFCAGRKAWRFLNGAEAGNSYGNTPAIDLPLSHNLSTVFYNVITGIDSIVLRTRMLWRSESNVWGHYLGFFLSVNSGGDITFQTEHSGMDSQTPTTTRIFPNAFPSDGLGHIIGFELTGLEDMYLAIHPGPPPAFPNLSARDTLSFVAKIFLNGDVLGTSEATFGCHTQNGLAPDNGSIPMYYNQQVGLGINPQFNTPSATGEFSDLLVLPPGLLAAQKLAWERNKSDYEEPEYCEFVDLGDTPDAAPDPEVEDEFFEDVSLLLHMEGDDESVVFTDSSLNEFVLTLQGSPEITTDFFKYGEASGDLRGIPAALVTPDSAKFVLGTEDFTLESYIYLDPTIVGAHWFDNRLDSPAVELVLYDSSTSSLSVIPTLRSAGAIRITGSPITVAGWYHVALFRKLGITRLHIEGVQSGSSYPDSNDYASDNFVIGSNYLLSAPGSLMDEVRITKGRSRYRRLFTPPTGPLWSPPTLWTPAEDITDVWLDFSDPDTRTIVSGAYSEVTDKSGNARNVSQGTAGERPTLIVAGQNGLDFARFNGAQSISFIINEFMQASGQTIFMFGSSASTQLGHRSFLDRYNAVNQSPAFLLGGGGPNSPRPGIFWTPGYTANFSSIVKRKAGYRWQATEGSPSVALTQIDGGTTVTQNVTTVFTVLPWRSIAGTGIERAVIDIYEIVALPPGASSNLIDKVWGYGMWRWGMQNLLPLGHPYKANPPFV